MRGSWKILLIGAVAAIALSSAAPQADAQWWGAYYRPVAWGCCYSPCCSPCYSVSCYSPCYDSCGWYLGVRPGPIRRLLLGPYRWYWGGGYSSCCTIGCWDSCCSGAPAKAGVPTPAAPAPATPTPAQKPVLDPVAPGNPPAAPAPAEPTTSSTSAETSGVLTVWVPYDAKVTINGLETRSTGSRRQFVSHGLKPGFSYKYVIRAQVVHNGQLQEDTRTVTLTAGDITAVAFGFNAASQMAAR